MKTLPIVLAGLALVAPQAALAKTKTKTTNYAYKVTQAQGTEVATFAGDASSVCANAGLCATSGTATYSFNNPSQGFAVVTVQKRGRRQGGFGDMEFGIQGTTSSNVTQPGAPTCVDSVSHRTDSVDVFFASASKVAFGFHGNNADLVSADYLGTHCAGPTESDMVASRAFPAVALPLSSLKKSTVHFELHSNFPFHSGPFQGNLKIDAAYTLKRDRKAEKQLNKGG